MLEIKISKDSSAEELAPIALAIHEIVNGLPVTMRSREKMGVRVENGEVIDYNYTGPVLEQVLERNKTIRTIPKTGSYKGKPVIVAPILDNDGVAIAAIGIVDLTKGIYDLVTEFSSTLSKYLRPKVGPPPQFQEVHVLRALKLLSERQMGRDSLSKELGIGAGSARTLTKWLKDNNYIKITRQGAFLTPDGQEILTSFKKKISPPVQLPITNFDLGKYKVAMLVKNAADRVTNGIKQRDAAIKVGALDLIPIICKDEACLQTSILSKSIDDGTLDKLRKSLNPKGRDVIIVSIAESVKNAQEGALAAALTLFTLKTSTF